MAKNKNVTAEEVARCIDELMNASDPLGEMRKRLDNGNCDDIPDAIKMSASLERIAITCLEFSIRMLNQHRHQEQMVALRKAQERVNALDAGKESKP